MLVIFTPRSLPMRIRRVHIEFDGRVPIAQRQNGAWRSKAFLMVHARGTANKGIG